MRLQQEYELPADGNVILIAEDDMNLEASCHTLPDGRADSKFRLKTLSQANLFRMTRAISRSKRSTNALLMKILTTYHPVRPSSSKMKRATFSTGE